MAADSAKDEHDALTEMVNKLYERPHHSHHMLAHLRKRFLTEDEEKEKSKGLDMIGIASWGAVWKDDMASIKYLRRVTDLTVDELTRLKKTPESDDLSALMVFAGQIPKTTELDEGCQDEMVRERFLDKRGQEVGSAETLKNLKSIGGLHPDGSVNWVKIGRYGYEVENDILKTIVHRATGCRIDVSSLKLDASWKQVAN